MSDLGGCEEQHGPSADDTEVARVKDWASNGRDTSERAQLADLAVRAIRKAVAG